jgi:chromosome segregation ATPase
VRQRDVQIFFADASSGASSTAFVRQGQIGLLISQKPLARRAILEEAAGIGGCISAVTKPSCACAPPKRTCRVSTM